MDTTFYLYILYSSSANKYYVGYTTDYQKRLSEHNTQEYFNTYTSKFRPWALAAVFQVGSNESEALGLERFIKKQKSRRLIEQLIDTNFIPAGKLAQLVRVPHLRD
jgi:putative endonuclease